MLFFINTFKFESSQLKFVLFYMSHSTFGNGGMNLIPRICVGNGIENPERRILDFIFIFIAIQFE